MISKFTSVVRTGIAASLMLIATLTAKAQIQVAEGFDQPTGNTVAPVWPAGNLPYGWSMAQGTDASNYWDRMNNPGVLPACSPHGGSNAMVRAREAYVTTPNDVSYLISKPYDLSARPGGVASVARFWIYRDAQAGVDNIQVYANNFPNATTGAPAALFDTANFTTIIPRCNAQVPVCGAGWNLYGFTIPANTYSIAQLYIIIKVTHVPNVVSSNVYIDDFSITTYPGTQTVTASYPQLISPQNTNIVAKSSFDNDILTILVNTTGAGPAGTGLVPGNFNFLPNGCTQANPFGGDVSNTKLWWTGGTSAFSPLTATLVGTYAGSMAPTFAISGAGLASGLDNGNNYFWLTYDIPAGATSNDCVDADFVSSVLGGTTYTCGVTGCTTAGCRPIDINPPCVPSYTAGDSWLNGSYTDNDYVKWVQIAGDPAYPPGINNDHNDVNGTLFPNGAGYPADPCVTSATYINGQGAVAISPFSNHPPDYQKFTTTTVASMPACVGAHGANSSRTAVFLETSVAPPSYNITVQCGTWFGANCIAAWLDWNHDGVFNNAMWNVGGEKLIQSGYMNLLTFVSGSFTVPVTGYYGQTTLRVREWYANNNMDPCSPGYYGEVEDYTVTLRPDCSPLYPGWKIWLGYTDDWNVNSNWCGGIPTINDNALIPGKGGAGFNRGATSYHPVIKTGVLATTKKLVMLNDTVECNAPSGSSLRVSDSLSIGVATAVNTSALIVDSSYADSAKVFNGLNVDPNMNVFRSGYWDQKMQMMFKTSELTGMGLTNGDIIDAIWVPIRVHGSTVAYTNFNVNLFYSDDAANPNSPFWTINGFVGAIPCGAGVQVAAGVSGSAIPQPAAVGAYPVNVFSSGSFSLANANGLGTAPALGSGYVKIVFQKPFTFYTALNLPLIVEVCYSMSPAGAASDLNYQYNTNSFRSVLLLAAASNTHALGTGCSFGTNVCVLNQKLTSPMRPNLEFKYHRVYQKYPINMEYNGTTLTTAQWANYGNFVPANSIVTFMGTSATRQNIDGANNTTFDELAINNNVGYVQQNKPATVNDTLWLTNGRLYLNGLNLTLMNNTLGALTRTNGYLYSESLPPNYGTIEWKMGGTTGVHTFPFLSPNLNTYIPFIYNAVSGTTDLTVGTYYPSTVPASMLPYPTGVTTVNSYNNPAVTDAPNMVRRFWVLTNTGVAPNADLTFTWAGSATLENPANGPLPSLIGQRWQGGAMTWDWPLAGQTNPSANSVQEFGVTTFNTPWALTRQPEPLPIKLLNFTAKAEKTKVRLDWVTASEMNNDYFTVDRTKGDNEFSFIDKVLSQGPSTNTQEYFTYDNAPLMGRQYYRLKQTDLNGRATYSDLVPVTFGSDAALSDQFEITQVNNYENGTTDVIFKYNSELPLNYRLIDKLGRVVINKSINQPINGLNIINLNGNLASGIYTLMIQSQSETITKKIFR